MIDLYTLWNAMPPDVQRKISCHDLKRIVDNLNPPPVIRVCGVDCHPGGEYCNGYCEGKAPEPLLFPPGKPWASNQACSSVCDLGGPCDVTGRQESHGGTGPEILGYTLRSYRSAPPQPDRDKLRMIRDVALQEGDWAVECTNPGRFLKVHPDQFGQIASGPAYSFFRENH